MKMVVSQPTRKRVQYAALLLLGGVLGASAALQMALSVHLRFSEEALYRYGQSVLRIEDKSGDELAAAIREFSSDKRPFCSDEELGAMRRFVYNATFVKDLGRVKDGYLYCLSAGGRLKEPLLLPEAQISRNRRDDGSRVDIIPGMLALAPDSRGVVFASNGVTAVLNPGYYDQLEAPPLKANWLIDDPGSKAMVSITGSQEPLGRDEVLAQRLVERGGVFYQPLCSTKYLVCVVASEARHDMLTQHPAYFISFAAMAVVFATGGALVGMLIASTILLLRHRQRSFAHRLLGAVRRREITCVYQPIVDLETRKITGAEALARWTNDLGEAVSPELFIAVADQRGFLGEITSLVMERVLEDLGPEMKARRFHVAINIATRDLMDVRFFAHVEQCLRRTGIEPAALGFEITERSTALQDESIAGIGRLRAAGHVVYLDDFGTGYSNLSYLHHLHADAVKIDRVFTQTIGTESVTASVVPQILEMAQKLGLAVIVEGIETEEQAGYFRAACEGGRGQGWLFGRPVPAAEFMTLLKSGDGEGSGE